MTKITNKRTKIARVSAAPHASAEPNHVETSHKARLRPMSTPETSEVKRTRRELEAIRAKLPAIPYGALDAKHRAPFVNLRAAMVAHRKAVKNARAGKTK